MKVPPMTLSTQDIFDQVATHLLKQNTKAWQDPIGNVYLDEKTGKTCAIGCLFLPGEYNPKMENWEVCRLIKEGLLPKRLIPFQNLLECLQEIHDNIEPTEWREELQTLAKYYSLSSQIFEELPNASL